MMSLFINFVLNFVKLFNNKLLLVHTLFIIHLFPGIPGNNTRFPGKFEMLPGTKFPRKTETLLSMGFFSI